MTKEKMTIHEALTELKTLDSRISKKIREFTPCVANRNNNYKVGGISREEFRHKAADDFKSICDLIDRRAAMKRAIAKSNAETKVSVCGKEYSIAEAIEMNNHGIELKEELLNRIEDTYSKAKRECDNANLTVASEAEDFVTRMYNGGEKIGKDVNLQKEQESYIEKNTWAVLQGIECLQQIEHLDEEIVEFVTKVNSALSVSNAITEIEIEY